MSLSCPLSGMSKEKIHQIVKGSYRPEIDGFRAFAVIVVIINHFNQDVLPGGYLGVDIFFVISGYVITSSLCGRSSKDFNDFIAGFYERRIKRLVPALSIFVLLSSIAICLFNPEPDSSLWTGLASLFGMSNLYLLRQSTEYFAQSTNLNIFMHTWSLGVEEQFYLLFPFLIWFTGFGRQAKNGARNLFLLVGTLTISSLISFLWLYPTNQPAAYFFMPSRFWEMAGGCLIFIGFQKRASIEQFLEKVPPLLILILIVGVMYLPSSWAEASTILIVTLSSVLIASLKEKTAAFKFFTNPKVVYIGLISYSLYLWHWGVLSISRWTIGIHWWSIPFQVTIIFCLAVASYQWIETPFRKGRLEISRISTFVFGGAILFIVSSVSIAAILLSKTRFLYQGSKCIPTAAIRCNPTYFPHLPFTPYIEGTYINRHRCGGGGLETTIEKAALCTVKPKERLPMIYVAGSSYVQHFSPVFSRLRKEYGYGITMLPTGACSLNVLSDEPGQAGVCRNSNRVKWAYILDNISAGDVVFAGAWSKQFQDNENVIALADKAQEKEFHLIYYTPIPSWDRLPGLANDLCMRDPFAHWFRPNMDHICGAKSALDALSYLDENDDWIAFLESIESTSSHFHILPMHSLLRFNKEFPSHFGSIRLYRDNSGHLSREGAEIIYPDFLLLLNKLVNT